MVRIAFGRLASALLLLLGISALCFALLHLAPGGPLTGFDPRQTAADRQRVETSLGLDRPLPVQYGRWVAGVVRGDLGASLVTGEPVTTMIAARLPATLELMGSALVLSLVFGLGFGIVAALHRDTWIDRTLRAASLAGISMPVFWLGILAILLFSARLAWLPAGGRGTLGTAFSFRDHIQHLVLPAAVLAAVQMPQWSRHMRSSLLEVLGEDWLRAARARGLPEWRVVLRHGVRPALGPVVTLIGLQIPTLFNGAVITESIFSWPGIGRLFFDGVQRFDYPRLMGILMIGAALVLAGNFAADLANVRLDPRLRWRCAP